MLKTLQAELEWADQKRFTLPEAEWAVFLDMLNRSPRVPEGLTRLFSKPSIAVHQAELTQDLLVRHTFTASE